MSRPTSGKRYRINSKGVPVLIHPERPPPMIIPLAPAPIRRASPPTMASIEAAQGVTPAYTSTALPVPTSTASTPYYTSTALPVPTSTASTPYYTSTALPAPTSTASTPYYTSTALPVPTSTATSSYYTSTALPVPPPVSAPVLPPTSSRSPSLPNLEMIPRYQGLETAKPSEIFELCTSTPEYEDLCSDEDFWIDWSRINLGLIQPYVPLDMSSDQDNWVVNQREYIREYETVNNIDVSKRLHARKLRDPAYSSIRYTDEMARNFFLFFNVIRPEDTTIPFLMPYFESIDIKGTTAMSLIMDKHQTEMLKYLESNPNTELIFKWMVLKISGQKRSFTRGMNPDYFEDFVEDSERLSKLLFDNMVIVSRDRAFDIYLDLIEYSRSELVRDYQSFFGEYSNRVEYLISSLIGEYQEGVDKFLLTQRQRGAVPPQLEQLFDALIEREVELGSYQMLATIDSRYFARFETDDLVLAKLLASPYSSEMKLEILRLYLNKINRSISIQCRTLKEYVRIGTPEMIQMVVDRINSRDYQNLKSCVEEIQRRVDRVRITYGPNHEQVTKFEPLRRILQ